jgi:hypothetical protein
MAKYYAGIGSRTTPPNALKWMTWAARQLESYGYILRSGGAKGADRAFENGISNPARQEIFYAKDCQPWALEMVKKYLPGRADLNKMRPYVQKLLGRNMMQVLGEDGKHPVDFVICWTSDGLDSGGTGYAIRCAKAHGIPVYNLKTEQGRKAVAEIALIGSE